MSSDERSRPERALDVTADLTLSLADTDVHITGSGDLVVVDTPDLRTALKLLRGTDYLPSQFVERGLARSGVVVDVRVRGGSIARAGPAIRPGLVSRVLGVEPARVNLGGVVSAALGR